MKTDYFVQIFYEIIYAINMKTVMFILSYIRDSHVCSLFMWPSFTLVGLVLKDQNIVCGEGQIMVRLW